MLAENGPESIEVGVALGNERGGRSAVMPPRRRRFCLMILACMSGGSLALVTSSVVKWEQGAVIIFALALIAGISALWSP